MSLTHHSLLTNPAKAIVQMRSALRVVVIMICVAAVNNLFYLYLYLTRESKEWQLLGVVMVVFIYLIVCLISLVLVRSDHSVRGVQLLIFGLLAGLLAFSCLITGFGMILGVASLLLVSIIAGQTLPPKQTRQMLISSIVVGITIIVLDAVVLDLLPLNYRLTPPGELQAFVPTVLGILILVYGFFVIRRFAHYSMRTKLIVSFLAVSIVSMVIVIYLTSLNTRAYLAAEAANKLKSLAELQALAIGDLLTQQVNTLEAFSLSGIAEAVEAVNAAYTGSPAAIEAEIEQIDRQWQAASENHLLVRARLDNDLAVALKAYRNIFPDHVELFVTDKYGAVVAATNRTSNYDQTDEDWWQAAFNGGLGATYVSQPIFDQSSHTFGLIMAIPLYARDTQRVVGVLRTTYRLATVLKLLDSIELGETGQAELYLPGGYELEVGHNELIPADEISPEIIAQLQLNNENYFGTTPDGVPILGSQAPLTSITDEPRIASLGWVVLINQTQAEALAAVEAQQRTTLFWMLGVASVTAIAAIWVAQRLVSPLTHLTRAAAQITEGDLTARVQGLSLDDEFGTLATAFNLMTGRLRETIDTLEEQAAERTRQLETVVTISQRLAGILDVSDLLRQMVTITKETFDYYHVHIYILDERQETLSLAEGYGEPGAEMKRQGHNIPLAASRSLVARAAREGRIITVENVRTDPTWLPNPLLPETRSEMAVPVMLGREVVGVLDVQSEKVGELTVEDETALQALANQIAVAVRNARLFTQTQEALYEAQRLHRLYTGQAWEQFSATRTTTNYEFCQPGLPPLVNIATPEAVAALQQGQTVDLRLPAAETGSRNRDSEAGLQNALATPLKLRGEIIGVLGIRDENSERRWTDDEVALIEAVSEQMSLALESARLFDETQRTAWRDRVVSEATAKVWSSAEIEEVMKAAVAQLGNKLRASEVVIRLGNETELIEESSL